VIRQLLPSCPRRPLKARGGSLSALLARVIASRRASLLRPSLCKIRIETYRVRVRQIEAGANTAGAALERKLLRAEIWQFLGNLTTAVKSPISSCDILGVIRICHASASDRRRSSSPAPRKRKTWAIEAALRTYCARDPAYFRHSGHEIGRNNGAGRDCADRLRAFLTAVGRTPRACGTGRKTAIPLRSNSRLFKAQRSWFSRVSLAALAAT
jgi:hypothetical protein